MMKRLLLSVLFFAVILPVIGREVEQQELRPGIYEFRNDGSVDVEKYNQLPIAGPVTIIRKHISLKQIPAEIRSKAARTYLRVMMCLGDFSWLKDPENVKTNGMTEEMYLTINGRQLVYKTSDPRFPVKENKKAPLRFRWVDIDFPVEWLEGDELLITAGKLASKTHDDYFYPCVKNTVTPEHTEFSINGGQTWIKDWKAKAFNGVFAEGEALMRLVIDTNGERWLGNKAASEISLSADNGGLARIQVEGGAKNDGSVLRFSGSGKAVIPGSESWNLPAAGGTIVGVARFTDSGNGMLVQKPGCVFLGRTGKSINLSFCCNGNRWNEATIGGEFPADDKWFHFAAVVEPFSEKAQGKGGFHTRVYINGELAIQKNIGGFETKIGSSDQPVELGFCPFTKNAYYLNGEIAEIGLYSRPWSAQEVQAAAAACTYTDKLSPGLFAISPRIANAFQNITPSLPLASWAYTALKRAASNGCDEEKLSVALANLTPLAELQDEATFLKQWNENQEDFRLLDSELGVLLVCCGTGSRNFPVAGLYSRLSQADVFAAKTQEWMVEGKLKGKYFSLDSFAGNLQWTTTVPVLQNDGTWHFQTTWKHELLQISSDFIFQNGRLESSLDIQVLSPELLLTGMQFPRWQLAPIPGGHDVFLYPHMSGILVKEPLKNLGMQGGYPQARCSLAMSAYYDEAKRQGVYMSVEDPHGRAKDLTCTGKLDKILLSCTSWIPSEFGSKGGNSYKPSGKAVIAVYKGDWFEAGQIYKKFVLDKADWAHRDLPRQDTPEWYRNLSWWPCASAGYSQYHDLTALIDYIDAPCAINWACWWDDSYGVWPHYQEREGAKFGREKFQEKGIKVRAYINSQLFAHMDGPNRQTDWQYTTHGKPYETRDANNNPIVEVYSGNTVYSVMCPAAEPWRKFITAEMTRTLDTGYDCIYWDQMPCCSPKDCHAANHGHRLHDPAMWLEQGYWKLMSAVKSRFPLIAHDGEDIAETYNKYLDGGFVWRWCDGSHVPLYQSIYAGQIQFVGRVYHPGDYQSYYPKMAEQFAFGEQLGGFLHLDSMRFASPRRLYLKRLAHLRQALLSYFNAGDMLRPLDFAESIPTMTGDWGGKSINCYGDGSVTSPQVIHGVWRRRSDGNIMIVFVNAVNAERTIRPLLPESVKGLVLTTLSEDDSQPQTYSVTNESDLPAVTLPPFKTAIWLLAPAANQSEIAVLTQTMRKIAAFRGYGPLLGHKQNYEACLSVTAQDGEWINAKASSWVKNGVLPRVTISVGCTDKASWFQADKDGEIFFGKVDFSQTKPGSHLELELAVDPERAGGTVEMIATKLGTSQEESLAHYQTVPLGDWFDYSIVKIPLENLPQDTRLLTFRFLDKGCNFRGWRIIAD